jgi:hypothetical protein
MAEIALPQLSAYDHLASVVDTLDPRVVSLSSGPQFHGGDHDDWLWDRAKELWTNADNIHAKECHRISLELAATAEELANQWDAIAVMVATYLADRAAAE